MRERESSRALYSRLAPYYDRIYWWKDYEGEVRFLRGVFENCGVKGRRVLDVACGTGNHAKLLAAEGYMVTGVDVSDRALKLARRKVGRGARFVIGDMRRLSPAVLGKHDAAICLFSSISYNLTLQDAKKTIRGLYDCLDDYGVAVFDTRFTKRGFTDGYRGEDVFDDGRVIGARLGLSTREGDVGQITFSYLIKDGKKTIVVRDDVHRLGLFEPADLLRTMTEVGFIKPLAYSDWTLKKAAKGDEPFTDVVFVGRKLASPDAASQVGGPGKI